MKTIPTTKVTVEEAEIGFATDQLLRQHSVEAESQNATQELPDLERRLAVNELTGASVHVPAPDTSDDWYNQAFGNRSEHTGENQKKQ